MISSLGGQQCSVESVLAHDYLMHLPVHEIHARLGSKTELAFLWVESLQTLIVTFFTEIL